MKGREGLSSYLTSQYRTKNGQSHRVEKRDTETTGTPMHREISGVVQVTHNGGISS
jgi:hypothetical protein